MADTSFFQPMGSSLPSVSAGTPPKLQAHETYWRWFQQADHGGQPGSWVCKDAELAAEHRGALERTCVAPHTRPAAAGPLDGVPPSRSRRVAPAEPTLVPALCLQTTTAV